MLATAVCQDACHGVGGAGAGAGQPPRLKRRDKAMAVSEDGRAGGQGWVVLVADDEPAVCGLCREVAESLGLSVLDAPSTEEALEKLDRQRVDLVLADLRMPSSGGMALLERVKQAHPQVEVILMTGYGSVETAVQTIKRGAYHYLAQPLPQDEHRG